MQCLLPLIAYAVALGMCVLSIKRLAQTLDAVRSENRALHILTEEARTLRAIALLNEDSPAAAVSALEAYYRGRSDPP